jgi:hypothetical protein
MAGDVDESEAAHSKHFIVIRLAVALPIGILSAVTVGITAGWQYAPAATYVARSFLRSPCRYSAA